MQKLLYITSLLLFLSACTKEERELSVNIDAELQPYIDLFISEGANRGIDVDFTREGLSARITSIGVAGVPGQCQQYSFAANELVIDPLFWNAYNETERELLIFHELGHCYLDRDHKDAMDEDGNCLSLMRSSADACSIEHFLADRVTLLNELFE